MDDGLMALLAVALGAALSISGALLTDWLRHRREASRGLADRRADAAVSFGHATKAYAWLLAHAAAMTELRQSAPSLETMESRIREAEEQRSVAFESLMLLCDASVIRSARQVQTAIWELELLVRDPAGGDWRQAFRDYAIHRQSFYNSVRESLGIASSLPPEDPAPATPYIARRAALSLRTDSAEASAGRDD